jgi:two-component system, OmpR family, response regulator
MPRLLLIDDDEHLAAPLAAYLKRFDLTLESALRPSVGLARLREGGFDAVILDVMLPEMDGFDVCREIRREPALAGLPILMLTARGDVMDRVIGLELGADDYLPKPFEPRELAARLQTILRRRQPAAPAAQAVASGRRLVFDGVTIDLDRRQVLREGVEIELTGTHKVFNRDEILSRLRGHEADVYTRAIDILISRIRKKLEPLDCIKTLRNAGYTFAVARQP